MAVVLLPPFLLACGSGQPATPGVTQRDSAGIVIVENPADMAADANGWGIEPEPFYSIGTVEGDEAESLYQVRGAHRVADGGVAIVNHGTHQVRVFSASGEFLRAFGREGDGPGEFRGMLVAGVVGRDTLVVLDVGRKRLTLIHPESGILRNTVVDEEASSWPVPSGVFADGHIVFGRGGNRVEWSEEVEEGPARIPAEYRTCDLQGRYSGSLGTKAGVEVVLDFMEWDGETRVRQSIWPLAKEPQSAVSSDRFYFGSQDAFEIESVDSEGRVRRLIRVQQPPYPVTADAWALFVEGEITRMARDAEHERQLRNVYERAEAYLPSTFPAHGFLKTDALDHLWVEEYRLPGEEALIWSVFDPQGIRLARVTLPRAMEILEIGRDYVIGLVRDELDVEYVQLFRLRRG